MATHRLRTTDGELTLDDDRELADLVEAIVGKGYVIARRGARDIAVLRGHIISVEPDKPKARKAGNPGVY